MMQMCDQLSDCLHYYAEVNKRGEDLQLQKC